jgi:hypothetical protein
MLADYVGSNAHGWYFLTPRARAIKTEADYKHFRHISLYPKDSIHPVIREETYAEFLRGDGTLPRRNGAF